MPTIGPSMVMDVFLRGSLASTNRTIKQAIERLSTGKRINRASDDVAGFMVADQLKGDRIRLEKSIQAAERHNHMLSAKDGALSVINDLAVELQGIVVQAGNRDVLGDNELQALQDRAESILSTFDLLAGTAKYQDEYLLKGFDSTSLGLRKDVVRQPKEGSDEEPTKVRFFDLMDGDLEAIQKAVDAAAKRVSTGRGAVGALMQQNESTIEQGYHELEAVTGELSRIEDADFAVEISKLVRGQILQQATLFSIVKERQQASSVMSLLS